jgi:hypothetical protein
MMAVWAHFFSRSMAPVLAVMAACTDAPRPTIRVGIGMTVAELIAGSTYPFADSLIDPKQTGDCAKAPRVGEHWIITQPYDLVYVHGKDELKRENLGGLGFLIAITATSPSCRVDGIRITFQNHVTTIDEALAEVQNIENWLAHAGFRPLTEAERKAKHLQNGIFAKQELRAPPLSMKIESLADVRAAFINPQAKITELYFLEQVGEQASASIWIENNRRSNEEVTEQSDESSNTTEREYRIYLDFSTRDFRLNNSGDTKTK